MTSAPRRVLGRLRRWWRLRIMPTIAAEAAYGMWAADYGRPANRFQELEQASLSELLPDLTGRRVLDVGCGTGRIARTAMRRGAAIAIGVDATLPMLARAAAEPGRGAVWAAANGSHLPFRDSLFEVLTCGLMLGHVADLGDALDELSRMLRPRGLLVISDFHPRASRRGWRRTVSDPDTGREYAIEHHAHQLADYRRHLERLGFAIEAVDEPCHDGQPVVLVLRARKVPAAVGGQR